MKKDKRWFVDKWTKERNKTDVHDPMYHFINEFIADVDQLDEPEITELDALNQLAESVQFSAGEIASHLEKLSAYNGQVTYGELDEPEVLSQEWVNDNSVYASSDGVTEEYVHVDDLQNLLVPKQEELEVKIQELIEAYKQEEDAYSNPENGWIGGFIEDLKNLLEEEPKYYVLGKHDTPILFRDYKNRITETSNLSDIYPKADSEDFEFTEQEIKDYDERYLAFRKPVKEMEE